MVSEERGWPESLIGSAFDLDPEGLELLVAACRDHNLGVKDGHGR